MILKTPWVLVAAATLLVSSIDARADELATVPAAIAAAIADPRRPREQIELDANRKPAQVIAFANLKPGDHVLDFGSGNAYFTRIFSDVVGPSGRVYAYISTEQLSNCSPKEVAGTQAIGHDPSYTNVTVLTASLTHFRTPEKLDVLWLSLGYHDLHDSFMGPADIPALNKAFFDALKPGGVFLVIDHVAEFGSGLRDTETLHRIDPSRMRSEIEAVGFVLEAESDVLRNADDDHKRTVFDPVVRGKTDQVVFRFRRPR
jgi:predicted methyltransferase